MFKENDMSKMEKIDCPYILNGYENRRDYLEHLAEDFGVPFRIVAALASMLGKDEDFDGLVSSIDEIGTDMMLNDMDNDDL